jgi:predicted acyl esterase
VLCSLHVAPQVDIWSTSYIFAVGHSIRVDISSSNYPRFSANTNTGQPLDGSPATVVAQNTIYFGAKYPSSITLPQVCLLLCS